MKIGTMIDQSDLPREQGWRDALCLATLTLGFWACSGNNPPTGNIGNLAATAGVNAASSGSGGTVASAAGKGGSGAAGKSGIRAARPPVLQRSAGLGPARARVRVRVLALQPSAALLLEPPA
jgi:hypothetical protein